MTASTSQHSVCPTPKVFVGQIPSETTQEDLHQIFSLHGPCQSILITGPDGSRKGCAMVMYESWTDAERAIDDKDGKRPFGGNKALKVRMADPPKSSIGIAPKKLFIGHVPSTFTEQGLKALFVRFGTIVDFALLKRPESPASALVTFSRWSECEAAIRSLNGSYLDGQDPITVKFADARLDSKGNLGHVLPHSSASGNNSPHSPLMHSGIGPFQMPGGSSSLMGPEQKEATVDAPPSSVPPNPGEHKAQAYSSTSVVAPYSNHHHLGYGMGHPSGPVSYGGVGYNPMLTMMAMPQGSPQWHLMNGMAAHMMHMNGMMRGPGMGHPHQGMMPYEGHGGQGHAPGIGVGVNHRGGQNPVMMQQAVSNKDLLARDWKLFIGQVPFSAAESDLWPIFSPFGTILELVVLRNQGRSKGCAFITYETREMADKAVEGVNGKICLPSDPKQRMLLVKFANPPGSIQKLASEPAKLEESAQPEPSKENGSRL